MSSDSDTGADTDAGAGAVVIAGHTGDLATVVAAIDHVEPDVRAAALGALERLDALDAARLATALSDPDARVRRRAAELAARHPDVDLSGALADIDPGVVEVAAWSCGEHGTVRDAVSDTVLERLVELATRSDEVLVRESAAAALGAIGHERGLPAVLAACRDKPAVRRRAVLALAPFLDGDHDHEVRAALAAALDDRDWQVRQAAEDLSRADRGSIW